MTILGKMLVFLILVLALVWNALVLDAYVTRTNWKVEAEKSQKSARESADAANKMKAQLDEEREAAAIAREVLRQENDRVYVQIQDLKKQHDVLIKQYQEAYAQLQGVAAKDAQYQANLGKLQTQVDSLNTQLSAKEKEVDDRAKSEEAAKVAANNSRIQADALTQQNDRLAQQIRELSSQVEEVRRSGRLPGNPLDPNRAVPAPEGFRGTIKRVDPPTQTGGAYLVTLEPGADAGLRAGAQLSVNRYEPKPMYVGRIVIISADPKEAVGQFVPAAGRRPGPEGLPKVGDELTPSTR